MVKKHPFENAFVISNERKRKKKNKKKRHHTPSFVLPIKYGKKNNYQEQSVPKIGPQVISKPEKQKKIKHLEIFNNKQSNEINYSSKQNQINFKTEYFPGVLEVDALIKKKKKKPEVNELLPQLSFMTTYIAPRNSGKTNNVVTYLTDKEFCFKKFDFIYIFSTTFNIDDTWRIFEKKYTRELEYRVYKTFVKEEIEEIFLTIEEEYVERKKQGMNEKYYLFLFDDMGDQDICSNHNIGPIETVAVRGRHYNVSGIILVQKRTMLSRAVRTNTTNCIIFDLTDNKEMKVCSEESRGELTHDEFMHIYKYCTHEKHNFLHINYQAPKNKRYRRNWNEIIHTDLSDEIENPKVEN